MENPNAAAGGSYPAGLKEDAAAALLLSSLKQQELSYQTAMELEDLKRKFGITNQNLLLHPQPLTRENHDVGEDPVVVPSPVTVVQSAIYSTSEFGCRATPPLELPPIPMLHGRIRQCSKPYEKQLTESDVKDSQNRLTLSKDYVRFDLLHMLGPKENLEEGINVTTYDSQGNTYDMVFKIWAGKMHVLTAGWKKFYQQHCLRAHDDWVTLWMFRHSRTERLCFAITSRSVQL
ncbi:hypothetical protein RJ639_030025 [Escallonia herrerae]|uniref:TF-B3 domain-containing protein n=1 Tax=Escallonia herrerae TaxID=1293975 RepID=A0AA88WY76_9ASTE|nr:hypothetical protein RJ639_030025 [Escallonia herrerae]